MCDWDSLLFTCMAVAVISLVVGKIIKQRFWVKEKHLLVLRPPVYTGMIPWLGCALEFGKSPLTFIEAKRKQLGPVFTLKVASERMTFLTEPQDFHLFFQSSNVDFQKAVQNAVQNVASITEESFLKNHTKLRDMVKGFLAATNLTVIGQNLCDEFKKHLVLVHQQNERNGSTEIELLKLVRSTMYKSVMNNLFGRNVLPTENEEYFQELERHFLVFDDQFEYGAKLPHLFLKDFSSAKRWLLSLFSEVTGRTFRDMPQNSDSQSLLQALLSVVDQESAPNWTLMVLWASLTNAIPITFWTIALIHNHPQVLAKVRAELAAGIKSGETISYSKLSVLPYIRQCVMEAIRLRSPGVTTRRVVKEFTAQGYVIPVGDLLMVSPYWAHRNPSVFPEPDTFQPERWNGSEKTAFPKEFIAFGGGRYQCPGRWFALMEVHLYVSIFITLFNCKLLNGVPEPCTLHVVGTQQPAEACPVRLTNCRTL